VRSHGAQTPARVEPLAQQNARRLLRRRGIRATDLSPIGRAMLRNWSRAAAALELLDRHAAEVGLLDGDGVPHAFTGLYVKLLNSERHALVRLHEHVRQDAGRDDLAEFIEARFGGQDEDD
jgi:hypothetical protein